MSVDRFTVQSVQMGQFLGRSLNLILNLNPQNHAEEKSKITSRIKIKTQSAPCLLQLGSGNQSLSTVRVRNL